MKRFQRSQGGRFGRWPGVVAAILLVLPLLCGLGGGAPAARAAETPEMKRALLATVSLLVPIDGDDTHAVGGSGSVLTADGYILTNMHVMADLEHKAKLWNSKGQAAVSLNNPTDLHALPVMTYVAQLVKGDAVLDLAVLKIVGYANKKAALPKDLGLVTMPQGDSGKVEFGDTIMCFGYPGLGGESVTFTKGTVAGFADENRDGKPDWIKTDAQVNHGNSGGAATNEKGEIIGVPTEVRSDPELAGRISYIRPINLARPLIEASIRGVKPDPKPTGAGPQVSNLTFTDSVDRKGQPGKSVTRYASGVKALYAVFDFAGFSDGLNFSWRWDRDGKKVYQDSVTWDQGASGASWVSLTGDQAFADGTYQVTLVADGQTLRTARVRVGKENTPASAPQFATPVFAEGVSADDKPVKPHAAGGAFSEGTTEVYAFMDYKNMTEAFAYTYRWLLDGEEVLSRTRQWDAAEASGNFWLQINSDKGLPAGHYRLEAGPEGQQTLAAGEFDIKGAGSPAREGVQVMGQIVDADTKRGINGAVFVVLVPGTDPASFLKDPQEADIYASATADRKGNFSLDKLLARGEVYTLVAAAKGYQPVVAEEASIDQDTESPLALTVRMQKR
ncbi:MAG TPA: trypsin-like peptidase domain-containing protein [Anaerolineae bacterium]